MPGIAWLKITDPDVALPEFPPDTDVRVLLPEGDEFAILADKFDGAGAQVRRVRYLLEDEVVGTPAAAEAFDYPVIIAT